MDKVTRKYEAGIAHVILAGVVVVVLLAGLGVAGFAAYEKKSSPDASDAKQASARGAYSSICGSGYNLRHIKYGKGFRLYNYKKPGTNRGCALNVNMNWGKRTKMAVRASKYNNSTYRWETLRHDGPLYVKYYSGPIYYKHKKGIVLSARKNNSWIQHKITAN